jgi:hypothetical protein
MARGPVQPGALRSKEEQQAARAAAVATIIQQLESGPKTAADLFPLLGCLRPTLSNYLRYMHKQLRLIHMTGEYRNRGEVWALGADPALPAADDELDKIIAVKRGIGPARQIGMFRHWMDVALFGPATAQPMIQQG